MKRLMLIDAQNQFIRSYIVNPTMTPNGFPIGGTVGFLHTLNKLCNQIKPDLFVVVWDGEGGSTQRRAQNKNYKMGRKPPKLKSQSKMRLNRWINEMSQEEVEENRLWQQLRTIEYVNQMPIIQFREPNVEADDVISYVKSMPIFSEWQKVVVSSDKDFIQLLDEKTLLFRPTQEEVLNTNRILETHSIHPNNFALARAMVGDKSDNIDGLPGVGLKTVSKAFPFLANDKDYLLSDIKIYSEEMIEESKLKIYNKVLEDYQKVCDNYSIMQLATPLISVQSALYINQTFEEYEPMLNMTEVRKMLSSDGMMSTNLDCLVRRFNAMIQEGIGFN